MNMQLQVLMLSHVTPNTNVPTKLNYVDLLVYIPEIGYAMIYETKFRVITCTRKEVALIIINLT